MKTKLNLLTLAAILMILALPACSLPFPGIFPATPTLTPTPTNTPVPTPTPAPTQVGSACLVGTWEMKDVASYIISVIPTDILPDKNVTVKDTSGTIRYTFDQTGKATLTATDYKLDTSTKVGFLSLPLSINLKGSALVDYQADARVLTFSNPVDKDLTVSATVAGASILGETPVSSLVWFGSGPDRNAQLNYQCQGNTLQIDLPAVSGGAKLEPAVFDRVSP